MSIGYYIGVSGVMGSGKTTLAKIMSSSLSIDYVPKKLNSKQYLNDLFGSINRWALETQLSFLIEKSSMLTESLRINNFVLDRILDEDINIFAKYFYEKGFIDERGFILYQELSRHFMDYLPAPAFIIYCSCGIDAIKQRLKTKGKDFQDKYPVVHIDDIYRYYLEWFERYDLSPVYEINSEEIDFHDPKFEKTLLEDLDYIFTNSTTQIDLFGNTKTHNLGLLKEKIPYRGPAVNILSVTENKNIKVLNYPYAYIAAPFTSLTDNVVNNKSIGLFDNKNGYGKIPKDNVFRKILEGLSKELKRQNINSLLPHRDVNDWGRKKISSREVYEKCIYHVENCDLFVGIIGMSHGVHLEYGYALARKKPCIIINCTEINSSYISKGISSVQENTLLINVEKLNDIVRVISEINLNNLIHYII